MAYPLLLIVSLTEEVRGEVGEDGVGKVREEVREVGDVGVREVRGEVGEKGVKEEEVEEVVVMVVRLESPSIPHCAFAPLCHHQ